MRSGEKERRWRQRKDQMRVAKIAELQRLIDEGLASGISARPLNEVVRAARAAAGRGH